MTEKLERFPILRKRLDQDGCHMDTADFCEAVCLVFVQSHRNYSDEDLLHEPEIAKQFCDSVRNRVKANVADRTILRTLTNARKAERFQFKEE